MKRLLFAFISAAIINVVAAQDTVRYPDHWYGYTPREALMEYVGPEQNNQPGTLIEHWYTINEGHYVYYSCANYLPTETPPEYRLSLMRPVDSGINQMMYGIAVTMNPDVFDTLSGRLVVYQGLTMIPCPSAIVSGAIVPYVYNCTVDSVFSIPFNDPPLMKECVFEYDYSLPTVRSLYSNCYEFYFDEPIDLSQTNTFIGITQCGFYLDKLNLGRDTSRSQEWYRTGTSYYDPEHPIGIHNFMFQGQVIVGPGKYEEYFEQPGYEDAYWYDCYWGMIFPILSPRCTAPKSLHIARSSEKKDTAIWRGDPESDIFQVSLTGYPASPDSGAIVTVHDTSYVLPEVLPDSICVAYVRKMCTFEFATHTDTVWGDWAGPVVVAGDTTGLGGGNSGGGTGDGSDSLAISEAQQAGLDITPNPATGKVTVSSMERMEQVELYDAAGAMVLRRKVDGHSATLNTATLPRGTYIVRITTPTGVTSRKLILQ